MSTLPLFRTEDRLPAPFIVGVGRSGTTLLRLMLDAHSEMAIPHETHFMSGLAKINARHDGADKFLNVIENSMNWHDYRMSRDELHRRLLTLRPFTISEGLRCFYLLYAERLNKSRWGDKTPPYNTQMRTIAKLLPEAHFIHLIRDGRDVALSLMDKWWGPGKDLSDQARNWVSKIELARKQAKHCRFYMEVRYEDLVLDTERQLRKICDFISLPFEENMMTYYLHAAERLDEIQDGRDRTGNLVSKSERLGIHQHTLHPPDPECLYRWREKMSPADLAAFEEIAGSLLKTLGYEVSHNQQR